MEIVQFVHEGLGNSSYVVGLENGRAAAIDPDRNVDRYIQAADSRAWKITHVLETHLHADFISGARELAERTGAEVLLSAGAEARFPHIPLVPGRALNLGGAAVEPLASPGHTPEHLSYVLRGGSRTPALFSGGSLIVGGAARTDLISPALTGELTRAQYRTIHRAFEKLPDDTWLYPTHGGGSFCSVGSGGQRVSTLGAERKTNPLLGIRDEAEFVRWFPTTFPAAPDYFFKLRPINLKGPKLLREIGPVPGLSPDEFNEMRRSALVVDVRPVTDYSASHIPDSLSIAFRDAYPVWLGWLVPLETPLLFVKGNVQLEDVVAQSALVGFENFAGYMDGGLRAWDRAGLPTMATRLVDAGEARRLVEHGTSIVDVRENAEFGSGHVPSAVHIPLGRLTAEAGRLPQGRPVLAYCGHGERSSTAISVLERAGFRDLANLEGGLGAWAEAGLQVDQ